MKDAFTQLLSGDYVHVDVTSFQNDASSFTGRDDVITYLIHLGYLGYNEEMRAAFIPNEDVCSELTRAAERKGWNDETSPEQKLPENLKRIPVCYTFNGTDITMNMIIQIKLVVKIIQAHYNIDFEGAVMRFYCSNTYKTLQQTENGLWAESAEYIADRYFEEMGEQVD